MAKLPVQFRLNGSDRAAFVDPADNLLTTLRRGLGDFAPKYGCGQGTCGVCTVLVDGEARPQLPDPCRRLRGLDDRDRLRHGRWPGPAPDPGGLHGAFRRPVRLLHARDAHGRPRAPWTGTRIRHAKRSSRAFRGTSAAAPAMSRLSRRSWRPADAATIGAPDREGRVLEFRKDVFADERDDNLHVVGKGLQRQDMPGHVTGRTRFFDDHAFEGCFT